MDIVSLKHAKEQGFVRYFTGEPCKRGHLVERLTSTRSCVACKVMHKLRWEKDNPEQHKAYNIAKAAEWREENRDRHRAKSVEIYWRNRDQILAKRKVEWRSNPEIKEKQRRYRASPEYKAKHVASVMAWRKDNPDKCRKYARAWLERYPERQAQHQRNRRAREQNASGTHTPSDILRIFKMQGRRCAYCRSVLRSKKHIDHIMPLALGGTNDATNLQLLCVRCNLSKGAKHPIEFAQSLGRLL